jgi:hypothetical protein
MTTVQFSISRLEATFDFGTRELYRFFFRTEWMEPREATAIAIALKQGFPSPAYRITRNEREIKTTFEELT